ncbi:Chromosome partition protein Smc [Paraburkholderia nemoris]|uniref:DNA-binding protein n=1 Tax=Paraburkholderia nemoris TaxID=2793076 RepID=UPI00190C94D8|nr:MULTISPECIES: DNA-binding protein [Paraburkholderia]MBK3786133.1 ATPase [Paraburkholderia aspalathi]CAE6816222.1 Chromosome partition protein Smc [Paraburkholderia nemoris]
MSDVLPDETRLAAEIDRLKAAHPKTRELYREVCALLFFRYGITPTANRLYQLVRRGSMGTPTAVLGEFWTELREKSRVRIEHPDLPAELGAAAGELVATLWSRATASAEAALDALRAELEAQRVEAQQAVVAARDELGRTETALEQRTAALLAAQVEVRDLDRAQAEGHAQRQALEAELARVQAALAARERELVEVREGFSRDLEKQREAAERAEERLRASEKRALLEIDRERSTATKLQKELEEGTRRADRKDEDHRRASETMQAQLGDARHQAGVLQGRLDAVQAENMRLQAEMTTLREAETRARETRASAASAGVRKTPRPTGSSRTVPTAKLATRRKKAV